MEYLQHKENLKKQEFSPEILSYIKQEAKKRLEQISKDNFNPYLLFIKYLYSNEYVKNKKRFFEIYEGYFTFMGWFQLHFPEKKMPYISEMVSKLSQIGYLGPIQEKDAASGWYLHK